MWPATTALKAAPMLWPVPVQRSPFVSKPVHLLCGAPVVSPPTRGPTPSITAVDCLQTYSPGLPVRYPKVSLDACRLSFATAS